MGVGNEEIVYRIILLLGKVFRNECGLYIVVSVLKKVLSRTVCYLISLGARNADSRYIVILGKSDVGTAEHSAV